MAGRTGIAIAGTHGKTTTTPCWSTPAHRGLPPTYIVGGVLGNTGDNGGSGPAIFRDRGGRVRQYVSRPAPQSPRSSTSSTTTPISSDARRRSARLRSIRRPARRERALVACADDAGAASLAEAGARRAAVITYAPTRRRLACDGPGRRQTRHALHRAARRRACRHVTLAASGGTTCRMRWRAGDRRTPRRADRARGGCLRQLSRHRTACGCDGAGGRRDGRQRLRAPSDGHPRHARRVPRAARRRRAVGGLAAAHLRADARPGGGLRGGSARRITCW